MNYSIIYSIFFDKPVKKGKKVILYDKKINQQLQFEKVPNSNSSMIVFERVCGNPLPCNYHYHPEIELTFIEDGSGRVLIGEKWHNFSTGSLFLIGSNIPHYFVSLLNSDKNTQASNIKFNSQLINNELFNLSEFKNIKSIFNSIETAIIFDKTKNLGELFEEINQTQNEEKLINLLRLLNRLNKIPQKILGNEGNNFKIDTRRQKIMEQAISFIQKNFNRKISIGDVAKSVRMERDSFRRFFQKSARMNFTEYLLELRLACACRLLLESSLPISEIAEKSGFHNLSNFNRQFLASKNLTPRQYRNAEM